MILKFIHNFRYVTVHALYLLIIRHTVPEPVGSHQIF